MKRRFLPALALVLLCGVAADGGSRISIANMGDDIVVDDAPFGASLRSMGGDIRIRKANGSIVAKTMGGNIAVDELAGSRLDAGTMGGNIRVRVVGSGGGRNLALHTMGGSVELIVPRGFDAAFSVEIKQADESVNSGIESDIPLSRTTTEEWSWFRGKHQSIVARKTASTQANRVEITTYSNRVVIRRE
jgi:DUF4097 and DUF4098 domain-containing protein YvlB